MRAWLRRRLGIDVVVRELAATREALAETTLRLDDLWARHRSDAEEARGSIEALRRDIEDHARMSAERVRAIAEEVRSALERIDTVVGRLDEQDRRLEERDRRADDEQAALRRRIDEKIEPLDDLRTAIRQLDIRLRTHVEEAGRTTAALLDRTGFPRLADDIADAG